jgi:hypothetical protein
MKVGNSNMGSGGPADFDDDIDDDDVVENVAKVVNPEQASVDALKQTAEALKAAPAEPVASSMADITALLREEGSNTSDADTGLNAAPLVEETPAETPAASEVPAETPAPATETAEAAADQVPEVEPANEPVVPKHTGGSSLSPEAQRKKAADDKAAERAMSQGGGGGGGLLSGALNTVGSFVGKGAKVAGKGVMAAGGQRFADRFLMQNDPMHVANGLFRARYRGLNEGIRGIDSALSERNQKIDTFNSAVERSPQGQQLKEMAAREKTSFGDYLSGLEKGTVTSPEAQVLYKGLQRDPNIHQLASSIDSANGRLGEAAKKTEANFSQLVANHSDKINPVAEENRILEKLGKAGDKKPLSLETQGTDPEAASTTGNSKDARKKFDEMIEKMKEAISAILRKIASAFGMK